MNDVNFELMFDMIKDTNRKITDMAADIRELKHRVTALEQGVATINSRMDRFEDRLDKIEIAVGINEARQ